MEVHKYSPQHVANFFLAKGEDESRPITPLKLLKLVYIAHGWNLALVNERLFDDEIEAWQHGPVIPSLYHEFKHYGKRPIEERASIFDLDSFETETPEIPRSDAQTLKILDYVWDAYKGFTGWTLRNKTHASGTPWDKVYEDGKMGIVIPDEIVKTHYADRIGKYIEAANI